MFFLVTSTSLNKLLNLKTNASPSDCVINALSFKSAPAQKTPGTSLFIIKTLVSLSNLTSFKCSENSSTNCFPKAFLAFARLKEITEIPFFFEMNLCFYIMNYLCVHLLNDSRYTLFGWLNIF